MYPPSGVARQSHCTLALLSMGDVARSLHFLTIALPGPGRGRLKKTTTTKNGVVENTLDHFCKLIYLFAELFINITDDNSVTNK